VLLTARPYFSFSTFMATSMWSSCWVTWTSSGYTTPWPDGWASRKQVVEITSIFSVFIHHPYGSYFGS
jgi:hypothetical protein